MSAYVLLFKTIISATKSKEINYKQLKENIPVTLFYKRECKMISIKNAEFIRSKKKLLH